MSNGNPTGGASRPVNVGDTLGQYKLVELIAVGGMGLVYKAYEQSLDRYVAVKVLAHKLARDPEIAQRFLNEARTAATLNHPNVVHVYSAGEQAGAFYFVMELVNGEHIEALLVRQGQLSVRETLDFIRQAAIGLQHAHEHGLIHGDVKPANFLVSDTGVVKVTDFGLARRVKALPGRTDGESLFGTPAYISPEVIEGQAPDQRSDIYSLGATLYHMLAGRPPFTGETPDDIMRQHVKAPLPPLAQFNPKISPALNQIVTRMLAKDPTARYQTYADLIRALDRLSADQQKAAPRVLAREPLPKTPSAPPPPPPPTHRESPLSVAFTLISVLACFLILYIVYKAHMFGKRSVTPTAATSNAPPTRTESSRPAIHQPAPPEHAQPLEAARAEWDDARRQIEMLRGQDKLEQALAVCDRLARVCDGIPELMGKIKSERQTLQEAVRNREAKQAATRAADEAARQARLRQLDTQFESYITGLQWEKGQQEIRGALAEAGKDAVLKEKLTRQQSEIDSLVALRAGVSERLKAAPSPVLTLVTTRGELQMQVTGFDADRVTLRQTFGASGYAETIVPWNELTPASICRLFVTCLDPSKPEELLGYAILIAHQALAKQARLDDARKTLQAVAQRDPSQAPLMEHYLTQLAALEPPPAPPELAPPKPPAITREFAPLDIGNACNADFISEEKPAAENGFNQRARFQGLPEDGRVPLTNIDPGGFLKLRTADKLDAIGLTWDDGRFPTSAAVKLPVAQQTRYSQLAILSASSVGGATFKVRLNYDTGDSEELKLKTFDWSSLKLPDAARAVVEAPMPNSTQVRHMFLDVIELDAKRRLTSITFTWISSSTEHPQHCVGIFAVSGLPADATR